MRMGALQLEPGALLAPMAGITDSPFRLLCREQGCAFATTEMINAKGLLNAPENTRAIQSLLLRLPKEGPVAIQLFGHEPDIMAEAAGRVSEKGFSAMDLNMGCPAPKIVKGGDGSALLQNPVLAERIIAAVRKATALPLIVKMRIGWDENNIVAVPFAQMAQEAGADVLVVHGRTRMQFYAGHADWNRIAEVKAAVRIPVIGNGDVWSAEDAARLMEWTGCDAVMVGRGALGNPWIFGQIRDAMRGSSPVFPTVTQRIATAMRHARMLTAWKGETIAVREMRKHGAWYTKGLPGAVHARSRIQEAATLEAFEAALAQLNPDYPRENGEG